MLANYGLKVPIRREAAIQRDIVDSVPTALGALATTCLLFDFNEYTF